MPYRDPRDPYRVDIPGNYGGNANLFGTGAVHTLDERRMRELAGMNQDTGFYGPSSRFAINNPEAYAKEYGINPIELGTGNLWNPATGAFEPPMTTQERETAKASTEMNAWQQKADYERKAAEEANKQKWLRESAAEMDKRKFQESQAEKDRQAKIEAEKIKANKGIDYKSLSDELKDRVGLWDREVKTPVMATDPNGMTYATDATTTEFKPSRSELGAEDIRVINEVARKWGVSPESIYKRHGLSAPTTDPNTIPMGALPGETTPTAAPATAPAQPQPGAPPVPGARQAADGKWYVKQGSQWFRVD